MLLSIDVSCAGWVFVNAYNVTALVRNVDWLNVMCYDLAGSWDGVTGAHTGLVNPNSPYSVTSGVNLFLAAGASAGKLLLACAAYGQSWTLDDSSQHGMGAAASAPGAAGPYSQGAGQLSWYVLLGGQCLR